jgi:hypothetical protein
MTFIISGGAVGRSDIRFDNSPNSQSAVESITKSSQQAGSGAVD